MAYGNASRRAREKRLRAKYRKKIFSTAIIMLVVGLLVGCIGTYFLARSNERVASILAPDGTGRGTLTPTAEPAAEAPVAEEPVIEEPVIEEPIIEEPIIEEPIAEEPIVEEPVVEEPVAEEPVAEEPVIEEPVVVEAEPTAEVISAPTLAIVEMSEPTAEPVVITEPAATEVAIVVPAVTEAPTAEPTEAPAAEPTAEPTAVPTEAPTAEPTAEPTVEPTAAPTVKPIIVPYGEAYTFQAQITSDGAARTVDNADAYETLDLTLQVAAHKDPAYFEANYAEDYNLQGNEAAVEFQLTLNGYDGETDIIPQDFLLITLNNDEAGITSQGFQLMNREIAGNTEVAISSGKTSTLFKRYPFNAGEGAMTYMVVTAYNGGEQQVYWFEITAPEAPEGEAEQAGSTGGASGEALTIGSQGDEVKKLQRTLIDMGLLSGQPDGKFGKYTADAVRILQGRYGMEQTGIADQAFLDRLYQ